MINIKFKDSEHPFLFAWRAYKEYLKKAEDKKISDFELLEEGYYLGFKCGAEFCNKKVKFTKDQFLSMLEENSDFHETVVKEWMAQAEKQKKIQAHLAAKS